MSNEIYEELLLETDSVTLELHNSSLGSTELKHSGHHSMS